MRAAVALRNVVRIGGKDFAVAVLPLHGDLDLNGDAVFVDRFLGVEDLLVEHRAALVLELDVGDEALVRQKLGFVCGALVLELDENTGVEERKLAQAREQGVVVELGDLLEDLRVGQEVHFRAATARRTEKLHRRDEDFGARDGILGRFSEAVLDLAAFEFEETGFAVAAHDEAQPGRKRVHAGDADAVQAAGHLHINVKEQNIDMLSLSGHKFHGPKGTGVLYARQGIPLTNIIEGGAQERGKRAGTENVPGIAAMAAALEDACAHMEENRAKVTALRDKLIAGLSQIPHSALNGDPVNRLPGNVNFCFEGIEGESLLLLLDDAGICASSGSACTSGSLDPSHVLLAIGRPHEVAHGSLRLSLSEWNQPWEIDHILREVPRVVAYLRSMSPVWKDLESGKKQFML